MVDLVVYPICGWVYPSYPISTLTSTFSDDCCTLDHVSSALHVHGTKAYDIFSCSPGRDSNNWVAQLSVDKYGVIERRSRNLTKMMETVE